MKNGTRFKKSIALTITVLLFTTGFVSSTSNTKEKNSLLKEEETLFTNFDPGDINYADGYNNNAHTITYVCDTVSYRLRPGEYADDTDSESNTKSSYNHRSTNNAKLVNTNTMTMKTIYVDDDRPPEWYDDTHVKTIEEGINVAEEGDTIYVYNGTYSGGCIEEVGINLIGENRENVIVNCFEICESENLYISTFTVRGGSFYVEESYSNTFIDCNFQKDSNIAFYESEDNEIINCDFFNTSIVYVYS